jgi:2-polyprenyl-3-methyl-5-hydroxy-6-metoxy-1,4-benzoquinol methylase
MSLDTLYQEKPDTYFGNARHDIVARLGTGPGSAVLELGCGAGGTGAAALAAGKAGRYTGLEMSPKAAATALTRLTEVVEGNVESLDLSAWSGAYDALIISEVLEHLTDPWRVVRDLAACLKPGSQVFASSPNVAHWRVVRSLLLGRFDYEESGVMDRTHLRWFTPATYRDMFEQAAITVTAVEPLSPPAPRTRLINGLTRNRFRHLFMEQIMVVGVKRP